MSDYILKFTEKATGKLYEGKRITANDYMLRDPVTGLKIPVTQFRLRKNFFVDKSNKINCCERNKKLWARVKLSKSKVA